MGPDDRLTGGDGLKGANLTRVWNPFRREPITLPEAMLGLMTTAAVSDGATPSPQETAAVSRILKRVDLFQNVSDDSLATIRMRVTDVLNKTTVRKAVSHYAPHLAPEYRAASFALCIEVLMADGPIDAQRANFVGNLRMGLSLNDDTATKIQQYVRAGRLLVAAEQGSLRFSEPDGPSRVRRTP